MPAATVTAPAPPPPPVRPRRWLEEPGEGASDAEFQAWLDERSEALDERRGYEEG